MAKCQIAHVPASRTLEATVVDNAWIDVMGAGTLVVQLTRQDFHSACVPVHSVLRADSYSDLLRWPSNVRDSRRSSALISQTFSMEQGLGFFVAGSVH